MICMPPVIRLQLIGKAVYQKRSVCGLASRPTVLEAWKDALAGDPVSAFGGVLVTNAVIDKETAEEINKLFFEVIIAPDYDEIGRASCRERV